MVFTIHLFHSSLNSTSFLSKCCFGLRIFQIRGWSGVAMLILVASAALSDSTFLIARPPTLNCTHIPVVVYAPAHLYCNNNAISSITYVYFKFCNMFLTMKALVILPCQVEVLLEKSQCFPLFFQG